MEKIKLINGKIFDLIPMGINTNILTKERTFSFISNLDTEEVEKEFGESNVSKIYYLSSSGDVLKQYNDCVSMKKISKEFRKQIEDGVIKDVYTVVLILS